MGCIMCTESKTCKAHLIPEALYEELLRDGATLKMHSEGNFSRKVPIGVYDENILCRKCDKDHFEFWDDYFIKLYTTHFKGTKIEGNPYLVKATADNVILFCLSVLWRLSKSTHLFASRIKLNAFQVALDSIIKSRVPCHPNEFSVIIIQETARPTGFIAEPAFMRFPLFNAYKIYLPSCSIFIKVDKRPLPKELLPFAIKPGTSEFAVMVEKRTDKGFMNHMKEFLTASAQKNRLI